MIITGMEIKDFRNYETLKIQFNEKTNILYGKNAQGKTNLLEAAFVSATTKSHKGAKDKEMIRISCEESHIVTFVNKDDGEYRIDMHLRKGKNKVIFLNRVPLKKASDLFGIVQVIFFSPEDLDIVKRGPEVRRRFIDMELCQIDKIYLSDLSDYKKVLNQRNKLLKDIFFDRSLEDTLFAWDHKLIKLGKSIIRRRADFINELNIKAKENYSKIAGDEELSLCYEPNVSLENFEKEIQKSKEKDLRAQMTTVGPHRDDIGFFIRDLDVRKYGSQGQQRSSALAVKLSEIEIVENHTGQKPILLLDDVLSELDTDRQQKLLSSLKDVQTIMTCTGMDEIKESGIRAGKVFIVDNAKIIEETDRKED